MNEFVQKELLWDAFKLSVPDTKDLFFQRTPNISTQCAAFHQKKILGLVIFSFLVYKPEKMPGPYQIAVGFCIPELSLQLTSTSLIYML